MIEVLHPRQIREASAARADHVQVCPPHAQPALHRLANELREWLAGGSVAPPRPRRMQAVALQAVRDEFVDALRDVPGEPATRLVHRVLATPSMHELWHLRVDVYACVARQHGEREADTRLATLNRHFPTRSPRSGFGAFDGQPR